ncbi:MAG: hypothetical protein ACFB4I_06460 [Cyanophyceae cyanobacterium]
MNCLLVACLILLSACSAAAPPLEFAPPGKIVQQAIALQLDLTQQQLSQRLKAVPPQLELGPITVQHIEPLFVARLPTYHLTGAYQLTIKLPHQQVTQKNNRFDIYLQRQAEGKTWRLLRREAQRSEWSSYLIRD